MIKSSIIQLICHVIDEPDPHRLSSVSNGTNSKEWDGSSNDGSPTFHEVSLYCDAPIFGNLRRDDFRPFPGGIE